LLIDYPIEGSGRRLLGARPATAKAHVARRLGTGRSS